jgi:hypothetical protein
MSRFADLLQEWTRLLSQANAMRNNNNHYNNNNRRVWQQRQQQQQWQQHQWQQHHPQLNFDFHPIEYLQPIPIPRIRPIPTVLFRENWIDNLFLQDNFQDQFFDFGFAGFEDRYFQDVLDQSLQTTPIQPKKTSEGKTLTRVELQKPNTFECAICLDTSQDKPIVKLPCCKQHLHEDCTLTSLKSDCRCPLCRQVIN